MLVLIPICIWFGHRPVQTIGANGNLNGGNKSEASPNPLRAKQELGRRFRLFRRLSKPGQRQVNTMYNHLVYEEVSRAVPSHQVPMFFGGMSKRQSPPTKLEKDSSSNADAVPDKNSVPGAVPISAEDYRVIETLVRALLDSPEIQMHLFRGASSIPAANYNLAAATPGNAAPTAKPLTDDYTALTFISPRVPRQLLVAPR